MEATVTHGAVTVTQVSEDEQFGVPAVTLTFASDRDAPVRVRVAVELPAELGIEEVGFHPEYRGDDWEVADGRLTFETDLAPEAELTTVYAVGSARAGQLAALLDGLTVEQITELSDPADTGGPGSELPPSAETTAAGSDTEATAFEWGEESAASGGDRTAADADAVGTPAGEEAAPAGLDDCSTARLLAELDSRVDEGGLTEQDRAQLRALLGDADAPQIARLQGRLAAVEACLESVLSDASERSGGGGHGTPRGTTPQYEQCGRTDGDFDAGARRLAAQRRLDALEGGLAEVRQDLDGGIEEITTRIDALESEVAALREDVESGSDRRESALDEWLL